MDEIRYNIIIAKLDERIKYCNDTFKPFVSLRKLEDLSIKAARTLRDAAKQELDMMTNVAMVELYHILGMGALTAIQQSVFIHKVKNYLDYRPIVKTLACNITSLDNIPEIPKSTKFKLSVLGDFYLVRGIESSAIEDIATIADYRSKNAQSAQSASLKIILRDREVILPHSELENFCTYSSLLGCSDCVSADLLERKIAASASYCGIMWHGFDSSDNAVGTIKSSRVYEKVKEFIKSKV